MGTIKFIQFDSATLSAEFLGRARDPFIKSHYVKISAGTSDFPSTSADPSEGKTVLFVTASDGLKSLGEENPQVQTLVLPHGQEEIGECISLIGAELHNV